MANELVTFTDDEGIEHSSLGYLRNYCAMGHGFGGSAATHAAIRFDGIVASQGATANMAVLHFEYNDASNAGSGNWKHILTGIKETDTADFSSSPFGRTKTTASVTTDDGGGGPQSPGSKEFDVTSIFNEIIGQGGWSSGNAMGFLFNDNTSSNDVWASSETTETYLAYRMAAEPNFTPTPISVSAPALPSTDSYGVKISKPSQSVLTSTEAQEYFTTRRQQFKVHMEDYVDPNATSLTVAHGLGYVPMAMVFIKYNGLTAWEKLPSSGVTGYYLNATNLVIPSLTSGDEIYYYIFLDELA